MRESAGEVRGLQSRCGRCLVGLKGPGRSRPKGLVACAGYYLGRAELRARDIPHSDREQSGAF